MKVILGSNYCGNIEYFSALKNAEEVMIEVCDHYEKQTYRNRTEIYGANGKLKLTIPLVRKGKRTPLHQMQIDYTEDWQRLHWRSIESAYRCSPYFEFYEDHFEGFYIQKFDSLSDFNKAIFEQLLTLLKIEVKVSYTKTYEFEYEEYKDFRKLTYPKNASKTQVPKETYMQVFHEKCGFIPNLSILDLLFAKGPATGLYL